MCKHRWDTPYLAHHEWHTCLRNCSDLMFEWGLKGCGRHFVPCHWQCKQWCWPQCFGGWIYTWQHNKHRNLWPWVLGGKCTHACFGCNMWACTDSKCDWCKDMITDNSSPVTPPILFQIIAKAMIWNLANTYLFWGNYWWQIGRVSGTNWGRYPVQIEEGIRYKLGRVSGTNWGGYPVQIGEGIRYKLGRVSGTNLGEYPVNF